MSDPIIAANQMGTGPDLVILHGLLGAARNWGGIGRDLSADYRVSTLDLPNHGGSGWIDRMDYPTQAALVGDWIEAGAGGAAVVLGHSMGGKVAMTLALTRPSLVRALIVADIAPVAYAHDFGSLTRAMQQVPLDRMDSRADVDRYLAQKISDPRVRAFVLQNLDSSPTGFRWRPNLDVILRSQDSIMGFPEFSPDASYGGAALFIGGGQSDYIRPAYHPTILKLFPRASFVQLPQAGHWLHADQPGEFLAEIRKFMTTLSA